MAEKYILGSDDDARKRLNLQSRVFEASTRRLLVDANIASAKHILEIGCGPGDVTELIVDTSNAASIDAIELDDNHLTKAKARLSQHHHIRFHNLDVYDLDSLQTSYDFLYCRMVLHHLHNPEKALEKMSEVLTPGARIVLEEPPSADGVFHYPEIPAFQYFQQIVQKTLEQSNIDYRIAYRMADTLEKLGLTIDYHAVSQPLLSKNQYILNIMTIQELGANFVQQGTITEAKLSEIIEQCQGAYEQCYCVSSLKMFQVIATKPE